MHSKLIRIYNELLREFGKQYWWPAETPFEVVVGAILTQQTNWKNVEKAIAELKERKLMSARALANARLGEVEEYARCTGFYKQKTKRLVGVCKYLTRNYDGDLNEFFGRDSGVVRGELLSLHGIGPETADSILLYAGEKPVFVIDAYTRRFCTEKKLADGRANYETLRSFFEKNLPRDVNLYREFHALIVEWGKKHSKRKQKFRVSRSRARQSPVGKRPRFSRR
ncbi:MAG: hypothetical protein AB1468_00545 [Candidatus Micrarchaeota archaeon]